jgi:hypothetical protein
MILNSVIFGLITILILLLSEIFNKKAGRKLFPIYYKRIDDIGKRLNELKNLIRLALINNDKKTYEKLQKEYAEFYNKVFIIKALVNSIYFIPIIIFAAFSTVFFHTWEMILPPLNFIIFLTGFYFLVKFIILIISNFNLKK